MFAPSEEGSKLKEYRGFSGAQLGIVEGRGQVHIERHTRNSFKTKSTFPKQEYEQRVSNGRYLPASEAILMNTRMMQNTLECAIYVGALSQTSEFSKGHYPIPLWLWAGLQKQKNFYDFATLKV